MPNRPVSTSLRVWTLQQAKECLSEVIRLAQTEGPQIITKRGKPAVLVIPAEEFEEVPQRVRREGTLSEFFARSPLVGSGIILDREPEYWRLPDG